MRYCGFSLASNKRISANTEKKLGRSLTPLLKTIKRKRVEVFALERERIVRRTALMRCPICRGGTEMLTVRQAGALAQTSPPTVRRWLARGQAQGVRTGGGQHRVCRNSLFVVPEEIAESIRGISLL